MNPSFKANLMVVSSVFVALLGTSVLAETSVSGPSSLELNKAIHFKSVNGEPVMVNAGEYVVEAAEIGLRLTPVGSESKDGLLIEAEEIVSPENLIITTPTDNPDLTNMIVLLSDGTAYETIGSKSGIWPRGWLKKPKHKVKKPGWVCPKNAKCKHGPKGKGHLPPALTKGLNQYHPAKHLSQVAQTLCAPVKLMKPNQDCKRKVSKALENVRISLPRRG